MKGQNIKGFGIYHCADCMCDDDGIDPDCIRATREDERHLMEEELINWLSHPTPGVLSDSRSLMDVNTMKILAAVVASGGYRPLKKGKKRR